MLLAEGMHVANIARALKLAYSVVWTRSRKLMVAAEVVTPRAVDEPDDCIELDVLELFGEMQTIVPEHLRR